MTELIDEIYEKIKIISDVTPNEAKTKFAIESIVQDSINYMNREDFPRELITPITKYIFKLYKNPIRKRFLHVKISFLISSLNSRYYINTLSTFCLNIYML